MEMPITPYFTLEHKLAVHSMLLLLTVLEGFMHFVCLDCVDSSGTEQLPLSCF